VIRGAGQKKSPDPIEYRSGDVPFLSVDHRRTSVRESIGRFVQAGLLTPPPFQRPSQGLQSTQVAHSG